MSSERPGARTPALLTTPGHLGTLATARCLGRRGVDVVVATSDALGPAGWSRSVSRTVRCRFGDTPASVTQCLLEQGRREPGAVLHPTSDEMAWLIAKHADDLAPFYRLYSPSFGAVRRLLDKSQLQNAAARVGLRVPLTFFPRDEAEAEGAADEAKSFVIKPRSQVFYTSHVKGEIASGPAAVVRAWRACRASPHAPSVCADAPDIDLPMLQELVPGDGVYSITGFVTRSGEVLAARASRKVLQRPSGLGVGVCFEAAPVEVGLVEKLGALARSVGFFGVFEAELVGAPDDRRLIDFNPRYYGQMAFDIARGAPLPWLLHLGALGHEQHLREEASFAAAPGAPHAYGDRVTLRLMLASQRITGTLAPEARRRWRHWLRSHAGAAVDATLSSDDPLPAIVFALSTVREAARHPRGFWRSLRGNL
jgi:D-aspartate ligase